jgi:leucyl aminopeptidase
MHTVHKTPAIRATAGAAGELDADLLIIPVFEDDDLADLPDLDQASRGEVGRARARREFTGKPFEVFLTPAAQSTWKASRIAFIGAGQRKICTVNHLRRIAITGALAARQQRLTRLAIVHRAGTGFPAGQVAQAFAEGAVFANFECAAYKTDGQPPVWLTDVALAIGAEAGAVEQAVERGRVLGEYSNVARVLANEPSNRLTPRTFADHAADIAKQAGLSVEILDEKHIEALKMGLLLGVARGSQEPPRVIVLRHTPSRVDAGPVLALVGKGITFDSGGISIKPAENMDKMKDDMSGGAAVVCAMAALSRLKAPVRCIGVIPTTENMPGGRAIKPGDVLTSAAGKTVEVLNTDAEGRLILGDGLWYARELGATHLVDVATLTGACVVALGRTTSGLFGTPDWWLEQVRRATDRAGDRSWPMPVFDDYKDLLKSEIADFTNTGGRAGGAITGALFVKEFAGDLPWVHMDIAGTAWAEETKPYQPKGPTGVAVRTLAELALAVAEWGKLK